MGEMKVFAVLDESTYVFGKAVESQEGDGEGHVGARWRKIAIAHGFVNNNYLQGFGAPWFFQVGGHAANGILRSVWRPLRNCLAAPKESAACLVWFTEAGEKVCSVFGELPALGFEFEVMGNERPVERWHPVGKYGRVRGSRLGRKCHVKGVG